MREIIALLPELGFEQKSDPFGVTFEMPMGRHPLVAARRFNRYYREVVIFSGIHATSHSIADIQFELPLYVKSIDHLKAFLAYYLESHVNDASGQRWKPAWFDEGLCLEYLLPWEVELAEYEKRPHCYVEREWMKLFLKDLDALLDDGAENSIIEFLFDGSCLKATIGQNSLLVKADGKQWDQPYIILAATLSGSLPKRLRYQRVELGIDGDHLVLSNRMYPGVLAKSTENIGLLTANLTEGNLRTESTTPNLETLLKAYPCDPLTPEQQAQSKAHLDALLPQMIEAMDEDNKELRDPEEPSTTSQGRRLRPEQVAQTKAEMDDILPWMIEAMDEDNKELREDTSGERHTSSFENLVSQRVNLLKARSQRESSAKAEQATTQDSEIPFMERPLPRRTPEQIARSKARMARLLPQMIEAMDEDNQALRDPEEPLIERVSTPSTVEQRTQTEAEIAKRISQIIEGMEQDTKSGIISQPTFDEAKYSESEALFDKIAIEIGNLTGDVDTDLRAIIATLKDEHKLSKEGVVKLTPYLARYLSKVHIEKVRPQIIETLEEDNKTLGERGVVPEYPFVQGKWETLKPIFEEISAKLDAKTEDERMDQLLRKLNDNFSIDELAQLKLFVVKFVEENPLQSGAAERTSDIDVTTDNIGQRSEAPEERAVGISGTENGNANESQVKPLISVTLRERKCDGGNEISTLTAYINEHGDLVLEGYDLGTFVEEMWGDSDYEYWRTVKSEYLNLVLLHLIKDRFTSDVDFHNWLTERNIPDEFCSWA